MATRQICLDFASSQMLNMFLSNFIKLQSHVKKIVSTIQNCLNIILATQKKKEKGFFNKEINATKLKTSTKLIEIISNASFYS